LIPLHIICRTLLKDNKDTNYKQIRFLIRGIISETMDLLLVKKNRHISEFVVKGFEETTSSFRIDELIWQIINRIIERYRNTQIIVNIEIRNKYRRNCRNMSVNGISLHPATKK